MTEFLSGKVRKTPPTSVPENRYKFLRLQDAEPDLGVASANGYILTTDTAGNRTWKNPNEIEGVYGTVYMSSSPPPSPAEGNLWWDIDVGELFVYYFDGTSFQWVQASKDILVEGPTGTYTLDGNLIVDDLLVLGTLTETSDRELKTNISTIENALDTTNKLRGVSFDWKTSGKSSIGLIAQEVEEILPSLVNTEDNGLKTLHYTAIIGLLIEAIKELSDKVDNK